MYTATKIALQIISIVVCVALLIWFVSMINPVLLPFIIAITIAYIANPLRVKLSSLGLPLTLAICIVMLLIFALVTLFILILLPVFKNQTPKLIDIINSAQYWVQAKFNLQDLAPANNHNIKIIPTLISQNLLKNIDMMPLFFQTIFTSGYTLLETIISIILVPILVFYFLRDGYKMLEKIFFFIPSKFQPYAYQLNKECNLVLGAFFRGQLLVMLFLCIYYSLALSLIGLQASIVLGLIIGILSIFPYIGAIVGVILVGIIALVQFGSIKWLLWVGLIFLIGHAAENFYLTPTLIGDRIGLHPVMVIFVILAGGALFGIIGIILAMPCAAVIMVTTRFIANNFHILRHLKTK
jgi:predicted PurR-regulated permease PerM